VDVFYDDGNVALELHGELVIGVGCTVGRCRLTVSKPVLAAPMVSALEPIIS
jgi:hypothetical protein